MLRLGLPEDRNVGAGTFLGVEEVQIGKLRFGTVARTTFVELVQG